MPIYLLPTSFFVLLLSFIVLFSFVDFQVNQEKISNKSIKDMFQGRRDCRRDLDMTRAQKGKLKHSLKGKLLVDTYTRLTRSDSKTLASAISHDSPIDHATRTQKKRSTRRLLVTRELGATSSRLAHVHKDAENY